MATWWFLEQQVLPRAAGRGYAADVMQYVPACVRVRFCTAHQGAGGGGGAADAVANSGIGAAELACDLANSGAATQPEEQPPFPLPRRTRRLWWWPRTRSRAPSTPLSWPSSWPRSAARRVPARHSAKKVGRRPPERSSLLPAALPTPARCSPTLFKIRRHKAALIDALCSLQWLLVPPSCRLPPDALLLSPPPHVLSYQRWRSARRR